MSLPNGSRDKITYNFIYKELLALVDIGVEMFFITSNTNHICPKGLNLINPIDLLNEAKILRRLKNILYFLKHYLFFFESFYINPRQTLQCCYFERLIEKAIEKYSIDIVHSHFLHPDGEAGVLSAEKFGIGAVATLRGAELYCMPDINHGARRDHFFVELSSKSMKKIDIITAPNKEMCEIVKNLYDIESDKVIYLPNGVEKIDVKFKVEKQKNRVRIIFVGRLCKRKNVITLLRALKAINYESLDTILVGIGPEKKALLGYIKKNQVKNVKIIEEMAKDKLFNEIVNSHCLILPSIVEGMPNVVLEALSLGVPVICSNISPHDEIVQNDVNGWLFEATDWQELKSRIEYLIDNIDVLPNMEKRAKLSVNKYSLENKVSRYLDIYNVLKNKKTNNKIF